MENETASHELMIDIETLGTAKGSIIASIAALLFDKGGNVVESLELNLELASQQKAGLTVDTDTVLWWMKKSEAAREATFFNDQTVDAMSGLLTLADFVWRHKPTAIWAHSPVFDIVMLECAFDAFNMKAPWSYKVIRDTRTIYDLAGVDLKLMPFDGDMHNAYADALHQISGVIEARERLAGRGTR